MNSYPNSQRMPTPQYENVNYLVQTGGTQHIGKVTIKY
ncbi:hypothetical protein KKH3_28640 [Pectobacterium actinidiae]|nr:hypothetical protein KKH3_28640 [Pectobacterium actinidiae]